jgi:hypothetical protein
VNKLIANKITLIAFVVWLVLLVPWFAFALASPTAYDAGPSNHANFYVLSIWTYPVSVFVVGKCRRDVPVITVIPCLNLAGFLIAGLWK